MEYLTSCCNTAFHGSGRYVHHFRYLIIAEPFGIKQNTLYATTLPGTFSNYRYNTLQRCPFVGPITGGIYVVIIIVYSGKHHAPTAVVLGDICIAHNGNNPRFEISPRIKQETLIQAFIYRLTGKVVGIFTEGDLRRLIERVGDIRSIRIADVMTKSPHTIDAHDLAAAAAKKLEEYQCNQLLVTDADGRLIGALHMHDLMEAKVI